MKDRLRLLSGPFLAVALGLSGCADQGEKTVTTTEQQTVVTSVTTAPGAGGPIELERIGGSGRPGARLHPQAAIYPGSGQLYNAAASGSKGRGIHGLG